MENKFLFDILRPRKGIGIADLQWKYPELMAEAIHRSPETLEGAVSEWKVFTELFRDRGLPVPYCSQYIEIQGLGIYGRSSLERVLRRFKRTIKYRFGVLWDKLVNSGGKPRKKDLK